MVIVRDSEQHLSNVVRGKGRAVAPVGGRAPEIAGGADCTQHQAY